MKPVSGKRMCKVPEARGWVLVTIRGSHHYYVRAGDPTKISVPVHGNRDLRPGTQKDIMHRVGLNDEDL
jgi:predicted RNA binding protein YcfA (HicA-like mRNA interferase family)